jgi:hypothetical protein
MESSHVWIRLRRTGGVAGLVTEATLDTADLDPGEARSVLAALAGADLDTHAAAAPPPPGPPDTFRYAIEVREGSATRTVELSDCAIPAALRPLVDELVRRAEPVRR